MAGADSSPAGVCSNVGGVLADTMIQRRWGVTLTRKTLNSAGFAIASLALVSLPSASSLGATVAIACVAMGSLALARGGYSVNHMDIAPRHPKASDPDDPLAAARALEVTSLWRLVRAA